MAAVDANGGDVGVPDADRILAAVIRSSTAEVQRCGVRGAGCFLPPHLNMVYNSSRNSPKITTGTPVSSQDLCYFRIAPAPDQP